MEETQTDGKLLPHDLIAEKGILSACLKRTESLEKVSKLVEDPSDFYEAMHQFIYSAILALHENGESVNRNSLTDELNTRNNLLNAGGTGYLLHLLNTFCEKDDTERYCRVIREKSIKRKLIAAGRSIIQLGDSEDENVEILVDMAEQTIFGVTCRQSSNNYMPLKKFALKAFERVKNRYHRKNVMTGISSGFRELDYCTEGLQRKNLIVVAAHPGIGKTAFCLNMGCHIAINEKKPVAVFSLDLSGQELARMILSYQSRVSSMRLRTGYLENSDWTRLEKALKTLDDTPIFIDDTPGLTVMELRSRARQLKIEKNIELIIIDSFQCIRRVMGQENRSREMSETARSLKEMARELNIPVVLTSQLSGNAEMRRDKRPMLSDLREEGNIEQDADVVIFLYREDYYNDVSESSNKAEIIITKNRDRCQEMVELLFQKDFLTFVPVEAEGDAEKGI